MTITGPSSLQPRATGQYSLVITGGAGVSGGFNVSVDNPAAELRAGTGQRYIDDELTHAYTKDAVNGKVTFNFSLVAPGSGSVRIYGAGLSCNLDGTAAKDRSSTAAMTVVVGGSGGGSSTGGGGSGSGASGGTSFGSTDISIEPKTGCSATGGASLGLFALAAAPLLRRRRS